MRPALMSAMVLIFAKCLGEFGVPYVLGLPVNFDVSRPRCTAHRLAPDRRRRGAAGAIMLIGVITLRSTRS